MAEEDGEAKGQLRRSTRTTQPAGDGDFVRLVEKLTGRNLKRRQRA